RATLASRLESLHGAPPSATTRPLGMLDLGAGRVAVGIAAAFGRLEAPQLRRLVAAAGQAGATDIRLSPWRSVYVAVRDAGAAQRLVETARTIGLIVEADDPVLRIDACPGAPACLSSSVDTRRTARRFAALGLDGSLHVSGCAKGCARSGPADLVLVGDRGRYNVIRNGTARDTPVRSIGAAEAGDSLDV
ncbi:MAG: precorrin-3B synthase, partial [Reyranella sp.]|nr:precorrin-3B synthase [Reyranella sp.]